MLVSQQKCCFVAVSILLDFSPFHKIFENVTCLPPSDFIKGVNQSVIKPHFNMKKLRDIINRSHATSTLAGVMLAATLAITFWFATAPKASAGDSCTLCHKHTATIVVECGSLDYRRHIDHGDTIGACLTPAGNQ